MDCPLNGDFTILVFSREQEDKSAVDGVGYLLHERLDKGIQLKHIQNSWKAWLEFAIN